jgi:glycerol-3-phosphate dehydrogenase (NAD(P)+)
MLKTAIIGAGLMGSAMAWPLSDNRHEVRLVGTHLDDAVIETCKERHFHPRLGRTLPQAVKPYFFSEVDEALEGCELIVSGVNSLGVEWLGTQLRRLAKPGMSVIGITKGLSAGLEGEVRIYPHILKKALPETLRAGVEFAAIGGPCIAGELAARRPTCVMLGAESIEVAERMAGILRTGYYHPTPTSDLVGLETGVALKNAYTLAIGIAYGLLDAESGRDEADASMHNTAAALFAQSCQEIKRILEIVGGSGELAASLPGAGDLYVTSMGGRTVRLGSLLGAGKSFAEARHIMAGETLESVEIVRAMSVLLPAWRAKGRLGGSDLPLMGALIEVVVEGKPLRLPLDRFFQT